MSRHRNIRAIDADEEYNGYFACYGHSVEDKACISPQTEEQFLYDRNAKPPTISAFLDKEEFPDPEGGEEEAYDSSDQTFNQLDSVEFAKLQSCVEALQDVVGDTIPEYVLRNAAFVYNFDVEQSLNAVLTESVPKPQRLKVNSDAVCDLNRASSFNNPLMSTSLSSEKKKSDSHTKLNKTVPKLTTNDLSNKFQYSSNKSNPVTKERPKPNKVHNDPNKVHNDPNKKNKVPLTTEKRDYRPIQPIASTEKEPTYTRDNFLNLDTMTKVATPLKDPVKVYKEERSQEKPLINMVVIGHVDAGKSTLMGHLLYRLGEVSKRMIQKFEHESKKIGKSSFMYAWVLDETPEERNRGITMDVAQSTFETEHRTVNLLDAPGHKDFIPNMITAATQADVAVLVIDATKGEFETGFEAGGQTREHLMLIRSLGVGQVAVAINKMDNVQWSEERYEDIVTKLSAFIKQTLFQESSTIFVPCSGLTGENLVDIPQSKELKRWYHGPTLVEVINNFHSPERPLNMPLRMCIGDVFKGASGGLCVSGKIETGIVKSGDKALIMPTAEQAVLKALTIDGVAQQHVFAGDHVVIQMSGIDASNVRRGSMLCGVSNPIKVTSRFQARLVIFAISIPITKGCPVVMHYQSTSEQAIVKKLLAQLHRSTGEVVKRHPRCLVKNSSAIVELETAFPVCIELFKNYKGLGKFMLRCHGATIAAGMVTEIF